LNAGKRVGVPDRTGRIPAARQPRAPRDDARAQGLDASRAARGASPRRQVECRERLVYAAAL